MLNAAEKSELITRSVLMIRDHGVFARRDALNESRVMVYDFDRFRIQATSPENPESERPVHLELRIREFTEKKGKPIVGQIFIADLGKDGKVVDRLWSAVDGPKQALAALRKLMVLEDLAQL